MISPIGWVRDLLGQAVGVSARIAEDDVIWNSVDHRLALIDQLAFCGCLGLAVAYPFPGWLPRGCMNDIETNSSDELSVEAILDRVREHTFHPVDETSFTVDRTLEEDGIADLDDDDWRVRLLAIRNLVRLGDANTSEIAVGLEDDDLQVRYICATALGILRAQSEVGSLERVVRQDPEALARSQAIVALGQIGATRSLDLLRDRHANDDSKDVRHQAELSTDRIEKGEVAEAELEAAYRNLDEDTFEQLAVCEAAPTFALPDTDGHGTSRNRSKTTSGRSDLGVCRLVSGLSS
jgi:hypothetical protein